MPMNVAELSSALKDWLFTGSFDARVALSDHFEELDDKETSKLLRDGGLSIWTTPDQGFIEEAAYMGEQAESLVTEHVFYSHNEKERYVGTLDDAHFDTEDEAMQHVRQWWSVDETQEVDGEEGDNAV